MITLREARQRALGLNEEVPGMSSMGDWTFKGCISRSAKYTNKGRKGGRVGLYDETLPVQIATITELRYKFKLADLAEAANDLLPELLEGKKARELMAREAGSKADEILKMLSNPDKLEELSEEVERRQVRYKYLETWAKYAKKYKELYGNEEV